MGICPNLSECGAWCSQAITSFAQTAARGTPRTDVRFELYPPDKNETDLELALRLARDRSPESILVIALGGGRIDQTLANLSLLTDPALAGIQVRADDGVEEILFCRSNAEILGNPGETVSLLPSGGPATGLRSQGLRWPLNGDTLFPEKSRGVSNELLDRTASVSIESGLLLIVHRHQT